MVIDWGLAKDKRGGDDAPGDAPVQRDGLLTSDGAILGTPMYMPPEQARGEPVDERADVYALGAILYELLAGQPAYAGNSSDILVAVKDRPPPPLREAQRGVPEDLASIVDKAMARQPGDRYPTAKLFAEDLERFQTGKLVGSHAYSRRELVRRFVVRNRGALAVAVSLGAALLVLGAASILRIVAERGEAERERAAAVAAVHVADEKKRDLLLLQAQNAAASDPTMALA